MVERSAPKPSPPRSSGGSYLMMNSELATSVMLGRKIIVVVLDNRGFGCITRLQTATGGAHFNNLLDDARHEASSHIDFVAHARALGAGAGVLTLVLHRDRHRSDGVHGSGRPLVGRRRPRGLRARGGARRARYEEAIARQRPSD